VVDGLHIHIQNRTMNLLAIALSGAGREFGGDLTDIQCKAIQNCHDKYILIKMGENSNK
jgi:hypothetical protein